MHVILFCFKELSVISWVPDSQGASYCIILPNSDTAEVVLPRLQGSELLRKWDTLIRISKTDVTK